MTVRIDSSRSFATVPASKHQEHGMNPFNLFGARQPKKYKLLKNHKIEHAGITLYRIQALKDFGDVKAGDLGGYVQSERNLDHGANAWIHDDSKAYGNSRIWGNAQIKNKSRVFGNARVFDSAEVLCTDVYGDTCIHAKRWSMGNGSAANR
jgi:hypothetical protein